MLWALSQRGETGSKDVVIAGSYFRAGRRWTRIGLLGAVGCARLLGVAPAGRASFHEPLRPPRSQYRLDNLRINSGTVSCPLPTWEDDSPDWQAIS